MLTKLILLTSLGMSIFIPWGLPTSALGEISLKANLQVELGSGGMVILKPVCKVTRSIVVDYYLTAAKQGGSGKSLSRQSGRVRLEPKKKVTLCTLAINLGPKDICRVGLEIFEDGKLLTQEGFWVDAQGRRNSI